MTTTIASTGRIWFGRRTIVVDLERKLADLWIGAFWSRSGPLLNVWICLLPCPPIHIRITKETAT